MDKITTTKALIAGYRQMIDERYLFEQLNKRYTLPPSIDIKKVLQLKAYFLHYIYPEYSTRQVLDQAFDSLDGHIKNPAYLLRLLIDSTGIMLRYGTSLPKILRAGIKALLSFRNATRFEQKLIKQALDSEMVPPISVDNVKQLIATLPENEIEQFIDDGKSLFEIILDRDLVQKIINIMDALIERMKKRTNIYSALEINGLELGKQVISEGFHLLDGVPIDHQKDLLDLIVLIERSAYSDIRKHY